MRIAIDTGGTFTDCVFVRNSRLEILKLPSTPRNPANAIALALEKILAGEDATDPAGLDLVCGTTVGTNALLQRRGGRVALVTTAGFEDVLEIGRQARPRLYDLLVKKAEPLVPQARRLGWPNDWTSRDAYCCRRGAGKFCASCGQLPAAAHNPWPYACYSPS